MMDRIQRLHCPCRDDRLNSPNITAHKAAYFALAESLEALLVTADGRLARAATDHADCKVRSFARSR